MATLSEVLRTAEQALREVVAQETEPGAAAVDVERLAGIAQELAGYRIAKLTPAPGHVHGGAPPDFELVAEPTVGLVDVNGNTCRVWVGTLAGVEVAALIARVSVPEGTDARAIDNMLFRAAPPEGLKSIGADQVTVVESPILMHEIEKLVPECEAYVQGGESAADVAVRLLREAREIMLDQLHGEGDTRGLELRMREYLAPWMKRQNEAAEAHETVEHILGADRI